VLRALLVTLLALAATPAAAPAAVEPVTPGADGPKRTTRATWVPEARRSGFPALSADGRIVAFTAAPAGRPEIFLDGPLR
jgi:hypothetical protein